MEAVNQALISLRLCIIRVEFKNRLFVSFFLLSLAEIRLARKFRAKAGKRVSDEIREFRPDLHAIPFVLCGLRKDYFKKVAEKTMIHV